jgi:hypothetical protein
MVRLGKQISGVNPEKRTGSGTRKERQEVQGLFQVWSGEHDAYWNHVDPAGEVRA